MHVGPDGELKAVYRKIHMFDVEVGGQVYRESETQEGGHEIVGSSTADGVGLGMTVCYDLRFPELYRTLAVEGARILLVPGRLHRRSRARRTGRSCSAPARSRTRPSWSRPTRWARTRPTR